MDSYVVDLLVLMVIFIVSSLGSRWMMGKLGYPLPGRLASREAVILVVMKLLLMSIWALMLLVVAILLGLNPLRF